MSGEVDIVERNRRFYREIVKGDGGESGQMKMLRELIEECERLRTARDGALREAEPKWASVVAERLSNMKDHQIPVGGDLHLLEMALNDYRKLRALLSPLSNGG